MNNEASAISSGDSSCSSSDSEDAEETRERTRGVANANPGVNDSHDDYKYDEMKNGNNHKDIFGHGITDNTLDAVEADSDLEDLRGLEQAELRRRKAGEERRRMSRQPRNADKFAEGQDGMNHEEMQMLEEQSPEEQDQGGGIFSAQAAGNDKPEAIQQLIKKKKERVDSQMRAKISNKFLK